MNFSNFDTIIDARTPSEFAEDHIPGAISAPVLDDAQRAEVGTMYKQVSAFEAKKVGAALIARNVAAHVEKLWKEKEKTWKPLVYCWRGGKRSGAMAHILQEVGWEAATLPGGYKAYRRWVVQELEGKPLELEYIVVHGPTGSGKSRLLASLKAAGAQVLDLESLAAHRGSVLGRLPGEAQPPQKLFESRQQLFKEGALPRKDLDQARVALTQAQSQYTLAEQHLQAIQSVGSTQTKKSAAGQLQTAEANLSYSEIKAPISGVVTDRTLFPGEMASAGVPLVTIMDTSAVIAKAHIPQENAALLKVGDDAEIATTAEEKFPARVTLVSPATDPNSTTVEVWAQAANGKAKLRPGTTVQLAIVAKRIPDALTVPASAVINTEAGPAVMMVVTDNKNPKEPVERAKQQPVKLGIRSGDTVQVTNGLEPGQTIVAVGAYGLPDNSRIHGEDEKSAELDKANHSEDKGKQKEP